MSVNQVSQSHAHQAEATQNVNSQKNQNANAKANAIQGNLETKTSHAEPATQAVAKTDNPAGSEQGRQQNAENDTNGTRVNVFA